MIPLLPYYHLVSVGRTTYPTFIRISRDGFTRVIIISLAALLTWCHPVSLGRS